MLIVTVKPISMIVTPLKMVKFLLRNLENIIVWTILRGNANVKRETYRASSMSFAAP